MLPGFELVGRDLEFWIHLHNLLRVGSELGEKVIGLVVLVLPAKPLLVHHFLDAGDGLDLLLVVAGQIEYQRHLVADDQALRQMVIRKVSSKSDPPMLSTVKMLRRLLRKAFLVTKRVKVILVNSRRGQVRMDRQPSLISIDEKVGPRQPAAAKNRT